jgi:hypothetical protein
MDNKKYYPLGFINGYYIFPVSHKIKKIYYSKNNLKNQYKFIKITKHGLIEDKSGGIATLIIKNNGLHGIQTCYQYKKNNYMTFNFLFKKIEELKPMDKIQGIDGMIFNKNNEYFFNNIFPNNYHRGLIVSIDNEISTNFINYINNTNNSTITLTIKNKKIYHVKVKIIDYFMENIKKYHRQLSFYLHNEKNFKIYYYGPLNLIIKEINGLLYIIQGIPGEVISVDNTEVKTIKDFINLTTKKEFILTIRNKKIQNYKGIRSYKNCFVTQWLPIISQE